jgi:hypothetical protein
VAYKTARMGLESTRRFHTTAHTMTLRDDRKRGEAGRSGSSLLRRGDRKRGEAGRSGSPQKRRR